MNLLNIVSPFTFLWLLMAGLMYGSGLRLMELLRLRIKDVDLERGQMTVRAGKGDKDRVTVLSQTLVERLRAHRDRLRGAGPQPDSQQEEGVFFLARLELEAVL